MIMDSLRRMNKQTLDQAVGGHLATLLAAILVGWGQITPAAMIFIGLGLSVVVICFSEVISPFVRAASISAAIATDYVNRLSRAAARVIIEALKTADRVVQILISAMSLRALQRLLESHMIIHIALTPKIIPIPIP
jgi:hypothetical protein